MSGLVRGLLSDVTYGVSRLTGGAHRAGQVRLLTYHRVTDAHPDDRLCIPVQRFEAQMRWLQEAGYRTVSYADATAWVADGRALPERALVLTFDDGFEDNFVHARPAMERHGLRGIFFVPSGFIQSATDAHAPADRPMSWTQLRQLVAAGHEIGGHSVTHRKLAEIPPAEVPGEARECKEALERGVGASAAFFCYPAGSYDAHVKRCVQEAGWRGACTVKPGPVRRGDDPFELTRTEISAFDTLWDFQKKLAGSYDWLHAAWQQVRRS